MSGTLTESERQVLRSGAQLMPKGELLRVLGDGPKKLAEWYGSQASADARPEWEPDHLRIGETSAAIRHAADAAGGIQQGLRRWAADSCALVPEPIIQRLEDGPGARSYGEEHRVIEDTASGRAVKFTKDGRFGIQGINLYLASLERSNTLFGIGNVIEGYTEQEGGLPVLVTSQPWVKGEAATPSEIDAGFAKLGYYRVGEATFFNPDTGEAINDAFPRNVLVSADGALHPIDVSFRVPTGTSAEMAENIAVRSPYYGRPAT